jgi:malonyl CoA-acyl carrier protein transacylase
VDAHRVAGHRRSRASAVARGKLRVAGVPEDELKAAVHRLVEEVETLVESYPTLAARIVVSGVLHDLDELAERLAARSELMHCPHGFVVGECVACFVAELHGEAVPNGVGR